MSGVVLNHTYQKYLHKMKYYLNDFLFWNGTNYAHCKRFFSDRGLRVKYQIMSASDYNESNVETGHISEPLITIKL